VQFQLSEKSRVESSTVSTNTAVLHQIAAAKTKRHQNYYEIRTLVSLYETNQMPALSHLYFDSWCADVAGLALMPMIETARHIDHVPLRGEVCAYKSRPNLRLLVILRVMYNFEFMVGSL
jgi:hypothetical protein